MFRRIIVYKNHNGILSALFVELVPLGLIGNSICNDYPDQQI